MNNEHIKAEVEINYNEILDKLKIELENEYKLELERLRNLQLAQQKFQNRYSLLVTLLTFIYIFTVTFIPIDNANSSKFADVCLGFLLSQGIGQIVNFYYGSTFRNIGQRTTDMQKPKDDCLEKQLPKSKNLPLIDFKEKEEKEKEKEEEDNNQLA